ncbi:MAG: hypothetical protein WB507_06145 [Solirubrobacterales bacterium]
MADKITEAKDLISSRLSEIEDEASALRQALSSLGGGSPVSTRKRGPGRPKGSGGRPKGSGTQPSSDEQPTTGARKKRRRRRGSTSQREADLLTFAAANPEAKTKEIAKALKIQPNYVSNLLGKLKKAGKIKRVNGKLVVS